MDIKNVFNKTEVNGENKNNSKQDKKKKTHTHILVKD